MTVSPQWPDEGNRPPFPEGNADPAQQNRRSIALPPTLFRLPNLRGEGVFSRGPAANQQSNPPSAEENFAGVVAEMPFENRVSSADPTEHPPADEWKSQDYNEDGPRFPAPPVAVNRLDTPATGKSNPINQDSISRHAGKTSVNRPVEPQDRPAGRSWMDSIGSHGIVVVLLLLVVAAALYTGGAANEDGLDSSLADSHDWLEYDTDEEIDLLNPEFGSESRPGPRVAEAIGFAGAGQADTAGSIDSRMDSVSPEVGAGLSSSGVVLSQPVETSRSAAVALVQNEPDQSDNVGIPSVQFEQSRAATTIMPTSPAANRSTAVAGIPNIVRQSRQPAGYEIPVPASESPQYRQTSTPVGIADWSKYFPNVSAGTGANTSYPSPSN